MIKHLQNVERLQLHVFQCRIQFALQDCGWSTGADHRLLI